MIKYAIQFATQELGPDPDVYVHRYDSDQLYDLDEVRRQLVTMANTGIDYLRVGEVYAIHAIACDRDGKIVGDGGGSS